jgi:hypothetical protein
MDFSGLRRQDRGCGARCSLQNPGAGAARLPRGGQEGQGGGLGSHIKQRRREHLGFKRKRRRRRCPHSAQGRGTPKGQPRSGCNHRGGPGLSKRRQNLLGEKGTVGGLKVRQGTPTPAIEALGDRGARTYCRQKETEAPRRDLHSTQSASGSAQNCARSREKGQEGPRCEGKGAGHRGETRLLGKTSGWAGR